MLVFLNQFLSAIGLRRGFHWGTLYDSKTKQPLDPVIVKIINVQTGKATQSCITDMEGKYGFLSEPGVFKILAKKTNYVFPSENVKSEKDGIYENLYHGEFFTLSGDTEVVSFNIPMDPIAEDWNQKAKTKIMKKYPLFENFLTVMLLFIFWGAFIFSLYWVIQNPGIYIYWVLSFYAFIFLLALVLPKPRLWGRIIDNKTKHGIADVFLEFSFLSSPEMRLMKVNTIGDGKFFVKMEPGKYLLRILEPQNEGFKALKSMEVKIGKIGICNKVFSI